MKRVICYIIGIIYCFCSSISTVFAQVQSQEISSSASDSTEIFEEIDYAPASVFRHNWFVGVGAGSAIYIGESDRRGPLSGRFTPAIDVSVGKWILPDIGVRIQYSGYQAKGYIRADYTLYGAAANAYGELVNDYWYKQKWSYAHFRGDVMFNLSNIIKGYKEDRFYSLTTYIGLGVITSQDTNSTEFTGTVGILNTFLISDAFDINLDIRSSLIHDRFDSEVDSYQNKFFEGIATTTIGVTYKFKPRGWKNVNKTDITVDHAELQNYKNLLANAEQKNAELANQLAIHQTATPEKELIIPSLALRFEINSSKLSKISRVNLGYIAAAIKESKIDKLFTIKGYADMYTGNERINKRLSENRAKAVYEALVNEFGVDKSKLIVEDYGGVDNMFYDDNTLSRVVIFE
ncbi:MAG: OmpA family protein [Rikenellaceae bacterium]